jgi:hypothetical protein
VGTGIYTSKEQGHMITKLFTKPHIVWQTADDPDCAIAEPALAVSLDASGLIVIEQEGRQLILNQSTVRELNKLLKQISASTDV